MPYRSRRRDNNLSEHPIAPQYRWAAVNAIKINPQPIILLRVTFPISSDNILLEGRRITVWGCVQIQFDGSWGSCVANEANLPEMDIHFALLAGFFARPGGHIDSIPSWGGLGNVVLEGVDKGRGKSLSFFSREENLLSSRLGGCFSLEISRRHDLTAREQPGYGEQTVVRFICERDWRVCFAVLARFGSCDYIRFWNFAYILVYDDG